MQKASFLIVAGLLVASLAGAVTDLSATQATAQQTRDPKAAQAPQVAGKGVLAGVVVSTDAGRPVRRARVNIAGGTPRVSQTIQTDDQGAFRFTGLPAGEYTLRSSKGGYLETLYGQRQPGSGRPGTPIRLIAGQELNRLSLPLAKGGVITGAVFDESGEPMYATRVRAYRWVMKSGERTLESAGSATTDDRGIYRLPMLLPGEYIVSAIPQADGGGLGFESGMVSISLDGSEGVSYAKMINVIGEIRGKTGLVIDHAEVGHADPPATGFATIYYPGTMQASAAVSVPVSPGEERHGVDFQLQIFPLGRMSGVVSGPDGPVAKADVRLIDRSAPPGFSTRSTRTDKDGRFEFAALQPGQYTLFARAMPKGGKPLEANAREAAAFLATVADEAAKAGASQVELERKRAAVAAEIAKATQLWAMADVSADGRDVSGVQLQLQHGTTISGQVVLEGGTGQPPSLTRMSMTVAPVGQTITGDAIELPPAPVDASGRFTIRGVIPGRYRLAVAAGGPSGYVLKSAVFGGLDVLDVPMQLTGNEQPAGGVVTLTTRTAEITGVVQDDANQPVAGVTVIAFSAEERFWVPGSRRVAAVRPSGDGTYVVRNLPPGDYRLVAVADVEPGQWYDPAFLRTLGAFTAFTVIEGARATHDIRVR